MLLVLLGVLLMIVVLIAWPLTELTWSAKQRNWVDVVGGAAVFGLILLNLFTDWDWIVYAMGAVLIAYLAAKYFTKPKR